MSLDRRLFDVTTLIKQGYDDQHSDGIPMICQLREPRRGDPSRSVRRRAGVHPDPRAAEHQRQGGAASTSMTPARRGRR